MKKIIYILFMLLVCICLCTGCFKKDKKKENEKPKIPDVNYTNDFSIDLIKVTRRDSNYLISPYSIEIALNLLNEGASGNTKKEIEDLLPDDSINDVSIKDRVKIANALFVKDSYKNKVKSEYKSVLAKKYDSEVLYDKFKTPAVINNWVKEKTDGMIEKVVDQIDPDFAVGLANAIAIDVEWATQFECNNTREEEFTKSNGKKIDVEMMHNSFDTSDYTYLESKDATGIIIPYESYDKKTGKVDYENGEYLEFIGILPTGDVDSYINNLTADSLNKFLDSGKSASRKYEIKLSLPRFSYEYEVPNFISVLQNLGIKDAFSYEKANFTNIMKKDDMNGNLYVSEAVHKTYIDLNEKGTKAAAVTYFGMKDYAALIEDDKEVVEIKFNKPFVYMIRDSKTKEILFFGAVYEPNSWKGSTCSNK